MGRQLFTILLVFVGITVLMRSCNKPTLPAAVETRAALRPEPGNGVELKAGDYAAVLARDGSLASVRKGEVELMRPVAPYSRPLHVVLVRRNRADSLLRQEWSRTEVEGGWRFTCGFNEITVTKTVRIRADGGGLDVDLEVTGGGDDLIGLWLTAAAGVPLAGPDDAPTGAVWRLSGQDPRLRTFEELADAREQERSARLRRLKEGEEPPARLAHADQRTLAAQDRLELFGLIGRDGYLVVRDAPATSRLKFDAFRSGREAEEVTNDVEAWLELVVGGGEYRGSFTYAWGERDGLAPELFGAEDGHAARTETLEDDTYRLIFSSRGACILEGWLKPFSLEADAEPAEGNWVPILHAGVGPGKRALTVLDPDRVFGVNPATAAWEVDRPDPGSIRFSLATPSGWRLVKTVQLPAAGRFDLGVELEIRRPGNSAAEQVKTSIIGPAGVYIADTDRGIVGSDRPAGLLLERSGGDDDYKLIEDLAEGPLDHRYGEERRGLLRAVAVRGAYFVCALITEDRERDGRLIGNVTGAQVREIELSQPVERPDGTSSAQNMMGRLDLLLPVASGDAREAFRFYVGPNRLDDLRPVGIEDTVDFGFFGVIGRGLMWLMKFFHGLFGSFGIAIIFMTLVVRALLLPISYKTQLGMSRYQKRLAKVKPLLDELEKKYKGNAQKLNQEKMRVMKENNVGFPLGCLTMFLQIPIWFALFQALRVEFSLRHQPFLWAEDLSMPDRLFALPFWPGWLNLFPILMLILWSLQQKMAPKPQTQDPQMQMQMKMMKYMPFMFFFLLYNYAAALSVYMCVSSTWGIFESKYVRKAIAESD